MINECHVLRMHPEPIKPDPVPGKASPAVDTIAICYLQKA
jgi:hypothetical protein